MAKITATIITYNEEARIAACLESLDGIADEIVVIDSCSTDATADICREHGCKVRTRRFAGFGVQRQYATSLATHPYVLSIDADEVLSPALRSSLLRLKQEGFEHRVYRFSRLNFYCGEPVRHCGWYPDRQIRLFDKRYANWNLRDVGEKVIFRDSVRPVDVDGDILHYRCDTPARYRATQRRHAVIRSRVFAAGEGSISPFTPVWKGMKALMKCYLIDGGVLDGRQGQHISRESFISTMLAWRLARRIKSKEKS